MAREAFPARGLLAQIARRHGDGGGRVVPEGPGGRGLMTEGGPPPDPPDPVRVTDALATTLDAVPPDEIVDLAAFARARDLLLTRAARTLRKARDRGPDAEFSTDEVLSLEAVVVTDGTRPSLMLRDGVVPADHPFVGDWRDEVVGLRDAIRQAAASVGRVEPSGGSSSRYFGTGFAVERAGKRLLLTNRHVLEDMVARLRDFVEVRGGTYAFLDGAWVDFAAEIGSAVRSRCRVEAAAFVGPDGPEFERLDAALLRLRPMTAAEAARERHAQPTELPAPIPLTEATDGPLGQLVSCCALGFPGTVPPPGERHGFEDAVDWNWVTYELMGGRHGVKRVAPALVHRPLNELGEPDPKGWCFGHDGTTLGGNSGSPILAWKDEGAPAFGLHFAGGWAAKTNYAHAMSEILAEMDKVAERL